MSNCPSKQISMYFPNRLLLSLRVVLALPTACGERERERGREREREREGGGGEEERREREREISQFSNKDTQGLLTSTILLDASTLLSILTSVLSPLTEAKY